MYLFRPLAKRSKTGIAYNRSMDLISAKKTLNELYSGIDGFQISKDAIQKSPTFYAGMIYDEMTDDSFYEILSKVNLPEGKVFIDLGSGVGKKVFLASLCFGFSPSIGLELVPDLYTASQKVLSRYRQNPVKSGELNFIHTDYNDYDLSSGDVLFLSLTKAAMVIELTENLLHKLKCLKPGTIVITTGLPIVSPFYDLRDRQLCQFQTDEGEVFINLRID